MWFEWKAVACKVCHCLHRIHRDETDLWVLKCSCCGESLGGCKMESLHFPKGGYQLYIVNRKGVNKAVPMGETLTRQNVIQVMKDWYGEDVDVRKLLNQLDEEDAVYDSTHKFAIKRVAD